MKIVDEQLRNAFNPDPPNMPWSNVELIIAIGEAPDDCGVSIRTDDGSSELFHEYAPTVRECLETLANRWEGLAKALRERAANGSPFNLVAPAEKG